MIINDPGVRAEVEAEFWRYEKALVENDVAALDGFFWNDPRAVRFGIGEQLYGYSAIKAFRAARPSTGLARDLSELCIVTYGRDMATTAVLFTRPGAAGKTGRQMQAWLRMPEGWKVVAAHVSIIDTPRA